MSSCVFSLALSVFVTTSVENSDFTRLYNDLNAVHAVAQFDLGSIPEKEAAHWAVLRIRAHFLSGGGFPAGTHIKDETGQEVTPKNPRGAIICKGNWERIGSLVPTPGARPKGEYHWFDSMLKFGAMADHDRYVPIYDGGFVLVEHFPDKKGKEQFGTMIVVPEEFGKWLPAAYQFYRKNADIFGEQLQEEELIKLLGDENPMLAVTAAQRLAKSRRFAGKALEAALTGPVDFRRAVAVYLAIASRNKDDAYVPPEMVAAIRAADPKSLRLYVIGAYPVGAVQQPGLAVNSRAVLKLCRERGQAIRLDETLRKELGEVFMWAWRLPSPDWKGSK